MPPWSPRCSSRLGQPRVVLALEHRPATARAAARVARGPPRSLRCRKPTPQASTLSCPPRHSGSATLPRAETFPCGCAGVPVHLRLLLLVALGRGSRLGASLYLATLPWPRRAPLTPTAVLRRARLATGRPFDVRRRDGLAWRPTASSAASTPPLAQAAPLRRRPVLWTSSEQSYWEQYAEDAPSADRKTARP